VAVPDYTTVLPYINRQARAYAYAYRLDEDDLISLGGLTFVMASREWDAAKSPDFVKWFKVQLLRAVLNVVRKELRRRKLVKIDYGHDVVEVQDPSAGDPDVSPARIIPHPEARRLAAEALRLGKAWYVKNPYHVRAELYRRLKTKSKWNYRRFTRAAEQIHTYLTVRRAS